VLRTAEGDSVPAARLLRKPEVRLDALLDEGSLALDVSADERRLDVASVETRVKYEGYLTQEASRAARSRRDEQRSIPAGFPFAAVPGLSREVVHRLVHIKPETLGQAARIPGVTPAAVAVLGSYLGRLRPEASQAQ
jgi:tRNA uridine 5-carboxymethylaminomethyl modification enzyme